MLDIKFIRENADLVKKGASDKQLDSSVVDKLLEVDKMRRSLQLVVEGLRAERNKISEELKKSRSPEQLEKAKKIKESLQLKEDELKKIEVEYNDFILQIPNPPKPDVKVGKGDTENDVIRKYKEPTKFSFKTKDHLELGELLDIIDVVRAAKVSGARFYYLKNEGAFLEMALMRLAFDALLKEGFIPILPPVLIKRETMKALGYMENGGEEDMFSVPSDDLILVGTSEQSIVPMFKDETLDEKQLPKRFVGFSSCFRREAGSYGKDTRGILRVHQFDKVEMVSFVANDKDDEEHEYLLGLEEKLFQSLNIPYQVVKMCSGDLGFPAARKYDIEAWMPAQNRYREVTSTSTCTDFQARRLNTRYKTHEGDTRFVSILNGTAFSMTRPIIAILENYQQGDGSVVIPEVLRKYTGFDKITLKKST